MAAKVSRSKNRIVANSAQSLTKTTIPNREAKIAELAYYKSESRGFAPGHEWDDWLEAERELAEIDD